MLGQWGVRGERRRHHRGRHCGCRGRDLLALYSVSHGWYVGRWHEVLHRLKLVTGVDISTRPVRRPGRKGKAKKSKSLRRAAEVKRMPFRRSKTILLDDPTCTLTPFPSRPDTPSQRQTWRESASTTLCCTVFNNTTTNTYGKIPTTVPTYLGPSTLFYRAK